MKLEPKEARMFYKLMVPLQFFVNCELNIIEGIPDLQAYGAATFADKFKVRNTLFDNLPLIDKFIDENPQDIPLNELSIVSSWKRFLVGDFFIFRHTKDHTIFIDHDERAFEVLGLTAPLRDVFPDHLIPQVVTCILLPFKENIITDGFFAARQFLIENDLKKRLADIYSEARRTQSVFKTL